MRRASQSAALTIAVGVSACSGGTSGSALPQTPIGSMVVTSTPIPTASGVTPLPLPSCIPSGTDATIQAALVKAGDAAVLCPGSLFLINNAINFTAPNQSISTLGLPIDATRATLRISTSPNLANVIFGNSQTGISIKNIIVDGNVGTLGIPSPSNGNALIQIGSLHGPVSNQIVDHVLAENSRRGGIYLTEGGIQNNVELCQHDTVTNNVVDRDGDPAHVNDGIRLSCGNTLVANNQVIDATDGGIVIFGAPGSHIQNNTVTALTQTLLGGITLGDWAPVSGNYAGTVVSNNTINAQGALIKVGIAMGTYIWGCPGTITNVNSGATVTNNVLTGNDFGYGYAVNGVSNWTVTGNTDLSRHAGVAHVVCGGGLPTPAPPAGFQYDPRHVTSSTLQPEFVPTSALEGLLGVQLPTN